MSQYLPLSFKFVPGHKLVNNRWHYQVLSEAYALAIQLALEPRSVQLTAWAMTQPADYFKDTHPAMPSAALLATVSHDMVQRVTTWLKTSPVDVVVDTKITCFGRTHPDLPMQIQVRASLIESAAMALRNLGQNSRIGYSRHLFLIAITLIHEFHHSMRFTMPGAARITPSKIRDAVPHHRTENVGERWPGEGGWWWEMAFLGGYVQAELYDYGDPNVYFADQIMFLCFTTWDGEVEQWIRMRDEDLMASISGSNNWSSLFPYKGTFANPIRSGDHHGRVLKRDSPPAPDALSDAASSRVDVSHELEEAEHRVLRGHCGSGEARRFSGDFAGLSQDLRSLSVKQEGLGGESQRSRGGPERADAEAEFWRPGHILGKNHSWS